MSDTFNDIVRRFFTANKQGVAAVKRSRFRLHFLKFLGLFSLLLLVKAANSAALVLTVADMVSPVFSAQGISLALSMDGSAALHLARLHVQQRTFRDVQLHCRQFSLSTFKLICDNGKLGASADLRLDFSYDFVTQHLNLVLAGKAGESWRITGGQGARGWKMRLRVHKGQVSRLAAFLPQARPIPDQGVLEGVVSAEGATTEIQKINLEMQLSALAFSDASGLHAADKLRGNIKFSAKRLAHVWQWQGKVVWQAGELYWQPLYLQANPCLNASGHTTIATLTRQPKKNHFSGAMQCGYAFRASGRYEGTQITLEQGVLDLQGMGQVQISAQWDRAQGLLKTGLFKGGNLALSNLFENYVKPFLDKGALAESALYGHADVQGHYVNGALQSLTLGLHEAGIADGAQRFALRGINTDIDWHSDQASRATITFSGGALLGATIGAGKWKINMNGLAFEVPQAALSVLDGELTLRDFYLYREASVLGKPCDHCQSGWHWQFAATLTPISMDKFSRAAGLPLMLGTLAGRIPKVSYDGDQISADGALLFKLFDGTVVATQLKLKNAFGRAPTLSGNLTMRNLDLDLLTRTFSFGNMQGRLDVDVKNLQLQDGQPQRFDAHVYSSAGNYPRKISQKAVQNISSLGGAGAVAMIQRSYLSFFKNFGYDRIGWRCVLRNGVCEMGGIKGSNKGPYVIVQGGGIPALTVMGYNRAVSWTELISRVKRVTQNKVKPIIK
ncbi:MAG: hypothetical protein R8K48_00690 [Gallionella sp.]